MIRQVLNKHLFNKKIKEKSVNTDQTEVINNVKGVLKAPTIDPVDRYVYDSLDVKDPKMNRIFKDALNIDSDINMEFKIPEKDSELKYTEKFNKLGKGESIIFGRDKNTDTFNPYVVNIEKEMKDKGSDFYFKGKSLVSNKKIKTKTNSVDLKSDPEKHVEFVKQINESKLPKKNNVFINSTLKDSTKATTKDIKAPTKIDNKHIKATMENYKKSNYSKALKSDAEKMTKLGNIGVGLGVAVVGITGLNKVKKKEREARRQKRERTSNLYNGVSGIR